MASLVQIPDTHLSNMDFSRFSSFFRQFFTIIFILLCLILDDLIGILVSAVKGIAYYRNLASGHAFPAESSRKTSFLADEIRGSLPVVLYTAGNRPEDGECAVCLCRFDEGEEIRELKCRHAFHRGCLDTWLDHDHTTCPLCRSCLLPEEPETGFCQSEREFREELLFWYSSAHGANLQSSLRLC